MPCFCSLRPPSLYVYFVYAPFATRRRQGFLMLAQATVNGILLGGLYGLATVGFSMVWGVMGVINLAHTAFITLGAYVTYVLFERFGVDPLLAMPVSMLAMFVLGYGIQRLILNRVIRTSLLLSLVVTFGI